MNNQDKYKLVRGRVNVIEAKALSFDRVSIQYSNIFEDDVKDLMDHISADIPIDVVTHVDFLTHTSPQYPDELSGSDIALIKEQLLDEYSDIASVSSSAYFHSLFNKDDTKAVRDHAPIDIPIDVLTHVVFLIHTCSEYSSEFPVGDVALIKERLLAEYGYIAALPRFAYLMGFLSCRRILERDEEGECIALMCEEAVADTLEKLGI